ncbi:MAG TPA: hypothetical protein VI542_07510, partial [Candidatus Tectomicrobia bacterium]
GNPMFLVTIVDAMVQQGRLRVHATGGASLSHRAADVMVDWTWPHDRGHMWEEISPHLSRYEVGLEPACHHAMLHLTLSRHSA